MTTRFGGQFNIKDMPEDKCPVCGYKINAASDINGNNKVPEPDDITFCLKCAAILVFKDDLYVRHMKPDDLIDVSFDFLVFLIETKNQIIQFNQKYRAARN